MNAGPCISCAAGQQRRPDYLAKSPLAHRSRPSNWTTERCSRSRWRSSSIWTRWSLSRGSLPSGPDTRGAGEGRRLDNRLRHSSARQSARDRGCSREFGARADDQHRRLAAALDCRGPEAVERRHRAGSFAFGASPSLADICLVPQVYSARRFATPLEHFRISWRSRRLAPRARLSCAARPEAQPTPNRFRHASVRSAMTAARKRPASPPETTR